MTVIDVDCGVAFFSIAMAKTVGNRSRVSRTKRYFIFASRKSGHQARVKRTTSSPVVADVMVHGHDLDASDILDHRLHDRTGRLDQMGPCLLQQVPSFSAESDLTKCCSAAVKTP